MDSSFCMQVDLVIAQVADTITLQPVLPASGLSACPGQDVTINCTIVRTSDVPGAVQPTLTWEYKNIRVEYMSGSLTSNSPLNNGVYTAVFNYSHFFVASTATILNVPLSHHSSSIRCIATLDIPHLETLRIAGISICYTMPSRDLCKIQEGMFDKPEGIARGFITHSRVLGNMLNTPQAVPLICKASVVQLLL